MTFLALWQIFDNVSSYILTVSQCHNVTMSHCLFHKNSHQVFGLTAIEMEQQQWLQSPLQEAWLQHDNWEARRYEMEVPKHMNSNTEDKFKKSSC